MQRRLILLMMLLVCLSGLTAISQAQQQIITVNVPLFWEMLVDEGVVEQFEAEHGVDVQFVYTQDEIDLPTSVDDVETYLAALTDYANRADVLYVTPSILTPEAVRAGFFVDLMPLASADSALNPADFHQAVWNAYQWDNSMWAVPTSAQVLLVDYIPQRFDEAGLIYPDASWTMDDYINAARELAQYDAGGNVSVPGMTISNSDALVRSLLQSDFTNPGTFPTDPSFTNPRLSELLETWLQLRAEGILAASVDFEILNEVPIRIGGSGATSIAITVGDDEESDTEVERRGNLLDTGPERRLAALPGNTGGLVVNGFAVSSGSSQPQLAYELVRYLSEQQVIANAGGGEPAHYNYNTPERVGSGPVVVFGDGQERTPEEDALVQQVLETGLNTADLRYSHYLESVLGHLNQGLTVDEALQTVEAEALAVMDAMENADVQLSVAIPETTVLAEGEIALNFGVQSFVQPLPNQQEWDALIAEFVAQDPQVGAINLDSGFAQPQDFLRNNDCMYFGVNYVEDFGSDGLLPLDPLVSSDSNYNLNDVPSNALEAMRVNGMLYGLPMTLTPDILTYNPEIFQSAGIAEPVNGWTMDEFIDALQQIDPVLPDDESPFVSQSFGSTYLLMLIAAQGGLPIDFSTDPITIDFTSPQTVAAIQTVLNLAKDGYIDYQALGQFGGGRGIFISEGDAPPAVASTSFLGRGGQQNPNVVEARSTTYPVGTTYTPVSYQVGGGFMNADTPHPEACYRWMSFLANHPHVLNAMPALLSTIAQPELTAALGEATVNAYQRFANMLNAPNAVNLTVTDFFVSQWLNSAFDAYVLEDADLLTVLQNAEQKTNDYLACVAGISEGADFEEYQTCVESVG